MADQRGGGQQASEQFKILPSIFKVSAQQLPMACRSFVADQRGGGAFTRALVAAATAAKKASPGGVSNAELMKAIEATLAEGGFKMNPALCSSQARAAATFFEVS